MSDTTGLTYQAAIKHLQDIVSLHNRKRKFTFSVRDRMAIRVVLEHIAPTPAVEFDEQWEAFNRGSDNDNG